MNTEASQIGKFHDLQGAGGLQNLNLQTRQMFQTKNNLKVFPLMDKNQIDEENSVVEKETPLENSHFNSPMKNNQQSTNIPKFKYTQQASLRDKYSRHYSIDVSKLQQQQFLNSQIKLNTNDRDDQDQIDTMGWQVPTSQNLKSLQDDQELSTQNEKDIDKNTTENANPPFRRKDLFKFEIKGDIKKRHSEYVTPTPKFGSIFNQSRQLRRNGVNEANKQLLGRITFLNVQSAQNQASLETPLSEQENIQTLNINNVASFMINKKLSISWRFINILVLIQTLTHKIKLLGQQYRFTKLNEVHYQYVSDSSHIQIERKNKYQSNIIAIKEFIQDLRIIKQLRKLKVLKPEFIFVILWKTFILIIILSQLIYIPIKIAFFNFNPELTGLFQIFLNSIPFAACIVDILINFNLAFFSAEGVVVQERYGIIQNYLRFPFWLDLITTVSLALQDFHYPDLCFLLRIFQIYEIVNYLDDRFQFSQRFNTPYTLMKLIATIIILSHIFGCGFYYMHLFDESYNWVIKAQLTHASWGTLYLKSLYFIIITMITVGFGDITPQNNAETIYILGIALLSCFQFGYTVNVIGTLFQEKAQQEAIINFVKSYKSNYLFYYKQRAQKYQVSTYMRQRMISKIQFNYISPVNQKYFSIQIDNSLQTLVLKNLDYYQTQQIDAPEQGLQILDKVSDTLKTSVRFDFYWRILKDYQNFLKALTQVMTEKTYIPGEFIYSLNQNSQTNSLYILLKGEVDLAINPLQERVSKKKVIVLNKKPGDLFGHFSFFTSQARETDCQCIVTSHIVSCTQEDFLKIARQFPNDYVIYQTYSILFIRKVQLKNYSNHHQPAILDYIDNYIDTF